MDMGSDDDTKPKWEEQELEELGEEEEEEDEDDFEEEEEDEEEEGLGLPESASLGSAGLFTRKAPPTQTFRGDGGPRMLSGPERLGPGPAHPSHVASQMPPPDHGDWTFEEQFKQLYELDADPKRKEFLDDLFSFMQKRGTPVNRIPIMAKQVLDLFMLYVMGMAESSSFLILGVGVIELPLVLAARPKEVTGSLGEDSMLWAPLGE